MTWILGHHEMLFITVSDIICLGIIAICAVGMLGLVIVEGIKKMFKKVFTKNEQETKNNQGSKSS